MTAPIMILASVASNELTGLQQTGLWAGIVVGFVSLLLGIVNYVHRLGDVKPRIRVRPLIRERVSSIPTEPNETVALLEVANVGRVAVHGSTVGFKGSTSKSAFIPYPITVDGRPWPREIEPGTVCLLQFDMGMASRALSEATINRAFMFTQTGEMYCSSKKAMREFRVELATALTERD